MISKFRLSRIVRRFMIAAVFFFVIFSAGLELYNFRMNKILRGSWKLDYVKKGHETLLEDMPEIYFTFARDNSCLIEYKKIRPLTEEVPVVEDETVLQNGKFSHGKCTYQDRDFFFEFDRVKKVPYQVVPFRVVKKADNELHAGLEKILAFAGARREFEHLVLTDRATGRAYYFQRVPLNGEKKREEL